MDDPIDLMQHLITRPQREELLQSFIHALKKHLKRNCNGFVVASWNDKDELIIHTNSLTEVEEPIVADAIEDALLSLRD